MKITGVTVSVLELRDKSIRAVVTYSNLAEAEGFIKRLNIVNETPVGHSLVYDYFYFISSIQTIKAQDN